MEHTVRFRLTDTDLEMLRQISDGKSLSATLRRLIEQDYRRTSR